MLDDRAPSPAVGLAAVLKVAECIVPPILHLMDYMNAGKGLQQQV